MQTHTQKKAGELLEADFRAHEVARLADLAVRLRMCGSEPKDIAVICNVDKRTVLRAMRGEPLKSDVTARLDFYCNQALIYGV